MVYVVDGQVHPGHKPQGDEYQREPTKFAHDGNALDLESTELHLFVCAACPWAHRALIVRNLSSVLRSKITVSVVSPFRNDDLGWEFLSDENRERVKDFRGLPVTRDNSPVQAKTLVEVYLAASPSYTGNITTPVLYDAKSKTIVSNDSFGIMRTLVRSAPDELGRLYLEPEAIDSAGRALDVELAKRVYMCGLAKTQEAFEASLAHVNDELDRLEAQLGGGRSHLMGDSLSLADIQLMVVLARFDPVYFDLFKCYKRRIASYPKLSSYGRRIAAELGDSFMLDLDQIVNHYWSTFTSSNPNGVIPMAYRKDFLDGGAGDYVDDAAPSVQAAAQADSSRTAQEEAEAQQRKARGEFVRGVSLHRNWLGDEDFPVEPGRYVLFVSNNCPWCHRSTMARAMYPGMEDLVEVSTMFYRRGGPEDRWRFLPEDPNELKAFETAKPELLEGIDRADPTGNGCVYAPDIYKLSDPDSTQTSVPILFDKKTKRVVSNESAYIVRMFAMISGSFVSALLEQIDEVNARIYQDINNGAYRAGFSSNQQTYEEATQRYFKAFDWLNKKLESSKYVLTNDKPTEVDLRLFPTIFRHDPVYHSRMKLNVAMVSDYPNLNRWFLDMKSNPAVQRASRIDHCVAGYFGRTGNSLVPFVGMEHDGVQPV